ncbi:GntR family transcriptional regulator [Streptomyces sp. H10-C2]|uniref:GntR family transcriptional regulator n=1 Tax=unclassified Streptomyces TaxID=2593676 RepID=UPI0024BA2853|nr:MULTISPECIES: GntR family transcriptional regulator [unclassified Streptomyces]MDJ0340364.1 GntR family transcriptional regulator [Streptomyces sp. PH10-H1]MDJ0368188.1 GntR family transcriptional regulator [Streptomyces sp. H10-C2]
MVADSPALPPYRRIAAQIKGMIERGELQPGDRIPSVREIIRDEGVSVGTATRVAAVLRAEGYAETIQGIGTVARLPHKVTTGPDRLQLQRATGSGFRPGERVEIVSAEVVPAPEEVADALEVDEGSPVVQRRRKYVDDDGVIALSTSWLPGEFAHSAPELISTGPLPKMTFGLIEDRTGRRAVKRRDVVSIRPVPEDVAPLLEVQSGSLALSMANHYWDQHGQVTEFARDFLGAGRELAADYDLE